jgi:GT2 family glycosyltransferase
VIPSCDRPEVLRRCLTAVLAQETDRSFEVVVVDDGRLSCVDTPDDPRISVLLGTHTGPAAARNRGIEAARGSIVCFTDDDTIPARGWIEAAAATLHSRPDAVGVEGPTECRPYDPLYTSGPANSRPGAYWTCNIAYRREVLLELGGFDEGFPHPFCEDRDLGERMAARGPILFAEDMLVAHPPRALRLADIVRDGRWIESEWRLYRKHPHLDSRWPLRWAAAIGTARRWQRLAAVEVFENHSLRRAARAAAFGLIGTAVAVSMAVVRWPGDRPLVSR